MKDTKVPFRNASERSKLDLPSRRDPQFIKKMCSLLTEEEFVDHIHRGYGCPSGYGFERHCHLDCRGCWAGTSKGLSFQGKSSNDHDPVELRHIELRYNKGKATAVALVKDENGKLISKGMAKKHHEDVENRYVGKLVALIRALGVTPATVLEMFETRELAEEVARRV